MAEPVFYYDFNSPYAYLAAHRVDDVLPVLPRWQPIAFGALIREIGKVPWSLGEERERGMRECERRAAALGLPLHWPDGWPVGNYSLLVLRAALVADDVGRVREFSLAAFHEGLGRGRDLRDIEVVLDVAQTAGVDAGELREAVERPEVKQRLRDITSAAVDAGVTGVPTVQLGETSYWGDDRLEEAAAEMAA